MKKWFLTYRKTRIYFFLLLCIAVPAAASTAASGNCSFALASNGGTGYTSNCMSVSADCAYSWNKFDAFVGIMGSQYEFNITGKARTWYLQKKYVSLGVGALLHFNWFSDIAFEHNMFFTLYFLFGNPHSFSCLTEASVTGKIQIINAIKEYVPYLSNYAPGFSITLRQKIIDRITLFAGLASYETYRYPVFLSPVFFSGGSYTFKDRFTGEISASVRYTDFFTLTSYIDFISVSARVRYRFE